MSSVIENYELHKIGKWAHEIQREKREKMLALAQLQLAEIEEIVCEDIPPIQLSLIKRFLEKTEMIMLMNEELREFANGFSLGFFLAEMLYLSAKNVELCEYRIMLRRS
jgi:hypothetical protein